MPILSLAEVIEQLPSLDPPISAEIIRGLEQITADSANDLREFFNTRRAEPVYGTAAKALFYQAALAIAHVHPINSKCPISQEDLTEIEEEEGDDLVTTSDGYTFRLTSINEWINGYGSKVNPATNQEFSDEDITTIRECAIAKGLSVELVPQSYVMSDTTADAITAAVLENFAPLPPGAIQPFIPPVVISSPRALSFLIYRITRNQILEVIQREREQREREQRERQEEREREQLLQSIRSLTQPGLVVAIDRLSISQLRILARDNVKALILSGHLAAGTALIPEFQNKLFILDIPNIKLLIEHNYLTPEEAFRLTAAQIQKIDNITTDLHHIYRAMCVGETNFHSILRFFCIDKCFKITKELNTMTLAEILTHADANPTSRTAKALEIYKNEFLRGITFQSPSLRKFALFSTIHEHCSSSPFARTTNKLHQVPEQQRPYGKRSQDINKIIEDNLLPQLGPAGS